MKTDTQIRKMIMQRIKRVPGNRLKELDEYVAGLEQKMNQRERILTYAGVWKNIDDEVFDDLTENLLTKRTQSKRRFDE